MEKNLELLSALLKGAQVTIYQLNAGDGQQTLHLAPEAKAAREADATPARPRTDAQTAGQTAATPFEDRLRQALATLWEEGTMTKKYDYALIRLALEQRKLVAPFGSSGSFLAYLQRLDCPALPHISNFNSMYSPHWRLTDGTCTFRDADAEEAARRNHIIGRCIALMEESPD